MDSFLIDAIFNACLIEDIKIKNQVKKMLNLLLLTKRHFNINMLLSCIFSYTIYKNNYDINFYKLLKLELIEDFDFSSILKYITILEHYFEKQKNLTIYTPINVFLNDKFLLDNFYKKLSIDVLKWHYHNTVKPLNSLKYYENLIYKNSNKFITSNNNLKELENFIEKILKK